MQSFFPALASLFAVALGIGIFALLLAGRGIGRRRAAEDPEGSHAGLGAVDGAVFGMLGLLIAFTFSGAAARFDRRRSIIVTEVNDIGTAWLRVDLNAANDEALRQQDAIWKLAVPGVTRPGSAPSAPMLLLPALNAMFDTAELRRRVTTHHPPLVIYGMLATFAMVGALLAGYGMAKGRALSRIHAVGFALVLAATVYVIVDLEYPRLGFIRVDAADQALVDLRRSMN